MWRRWIFVPIAAVIVVADLITKTWVRTLPGDFHSPELLHFSIIHITNTGSAFGLFADQSFILTIIAIIGIIVVLVFYRKLGASNIVAGVAIGLILGGAIGNLIDSIFYGKVTDWVLFRFWDEFYWPTFNVADSALTIGIIMLIVFIVTTMFKKDEQKA